MGFRSYQHDPTPGTIGTLKPGKSGRGVSRPVYQYPEEDESDELDDFVDNLVSDLDQSAIHKKIGSDYKGGVDAYSPRGAKQYFVGGNTVLEFAGHHRSPARKGISPFKQPKHSGPPLGTGSASQAFRTTGNFIGIGTQYGSSRPHKLLGDIEDNPVYNLDDILAPFERSFLRRNNRVKKVLNLLKEYLTL